MMQQVTRLYQSSFHQVNEWSQPHQDPMKRMFLTRFTSIVCAIAEIALLAFKTFDGMAFASRKCLRIRSGTAISFPKEMQNRGKEIGRLILGLMGTFVLGIVFSPTANFRLHVRLKFVTDHFKERELRERLIKLAAEEKKRELEQSRTAVYALLERQQNHKEVDDVEARLQELLQGSK